MLKDFSTPHTKLILEIPQYIKGNIPSCVLQFDKPVPAAQNIRLGGQCDLVCPIDTMHHSLDHLPLAAAYRKNVSYAEFDAGHMMYINRPDLKKMQGEIRKFVRP